MTTPRPIGLTASQLDTLMAGARRLPTEWRERYLRDVADQLEPLAEINDKHVERAVANSLRRMAVKAAKAS